MTIEQLCRRRGTLLLGAVLAVVCATFTGCEMAWPSSRRMGSFYMTGDGMLDAIRNVRKKATPEDQAVIDELMGREDLVVHVFRKVGSFSDKESRGGASGVAIDKRIKPLCPGHPEVDGVPWERDWDVVYDPELTEQFEKQYGIPTPVEVVLYHEIFGHVLPLLRDPGPLKKHPKVDEHFKMVNECQALDLENRFCKHIGLREIPPKLVGCSSP